MHIYIHTCTHTILATLNQNATFSDTSAVLWNKAHVHAHTHEHTRLHTCAHVGMHVHTHTAGTHVHTQVCVHTQAHEYVRIHTHTCTRKHTHTNMHARVHACMCVWAHAYTHTHIHMYMRILLSTRIATINSITYLFSTKIWSISASPVTPWAMIHGCRWSSRCVQRASRSLNLI